MYVDPRTEKPQKEKSPHLMYSGHSHTLKRCAFFLSINCSASVLGICISTFSITKVVCYILSFLAKKKGIENINYLDGITLKLEVYVKTTESKSKKGHRELRETGR